MASEILTKTAVARLTPANPAVIIAVQTHTMSLTPSGPFVTSEGLETLTKADIEASFSTYVTPYVKGPYSVPGVLTYASLQSIQDLSELVKKDGQAIALKKTTGTITCSVTPAQTPPIASSPDPAVTCDLDFSFVVPGQTLTKSD